MGGKNSGRRTTKAPIEFCPHLKVYERQPKESDQAWEAFLKYRELGASRSLAAVGESLGKSTALMERWSSDWSWRLRVEEWDRELDRRRREADLQAVEDMRQRQLQQSLLMQGLGTLELQKLLVQAQAQPTTPIITVDQARNLTLDGAKQERLNRNEPGEITEERTRTLDPEQVEQRIAHLLKARQKR